MSQRIEALVKAEKKLNPNVDFYSASTYYALGIPIDLYTPIFAVSRISGWTAHVLEQYANNRLIRPRADYIGPPYPQTFSLPIDRRTAQAIDVRHGPALHPQFFSIIAHIDHGKSTLADRFLEMTGALQAREMEAQVLDTMDLERERGITIKAHPVRLNYTAKDGQKYVLNLIDTPGHVDFSYEVTRSLAACEGALLLVDASQGVEAQTLANAYLAVENNLEIIPVINKIDLPGAQPEEARRQIRGHHRPRRERARFSRARRKAPASPRSSRRSSTGLPPPAGRSRRAAQGADLRLLVRPVPRRRHRRARHRRRAAAGMKIRLMAEGQDYEVEQLGVFSPKPVPVESLGVGEVGLHRREHQERRRREDRRHDHRDRGRPTTTPFPGFKELKPMVFAGLYPVEGHRVRRSCARRSRSCG